MVILGRGFKVAGVNLMALVVVRNYWADLGNSWLFAAIGLRAWILCADGSSKILYADQFAKPLANLLIVIGLFRLFRGFRLAGKVY